MKNYKITVIKGDGIGPEIVNEAIKVLDAAAQKFDFEIEYTEALLGGAAIDATGEPLPQETIKKCKNSDAVLLGAVGGLKWDNLPGNKRPEAGLLSIRKELNLFANLRPAVIFDSLKEASPLKNNIIKNGVDILIVRELTGGIYFGKRNTETKTDETGKIIEYAYDTEEYSNEEIKRIAKVAFKLAQGRGKRLMSVDKANVLDSSRLWRKIVKEVSAEYSDIELNNMYIDNCAMQLVCNPSQFDVIVTSNIFGDILSDEASMISGSIGMLPSASLGESSFGLYEPIHGSAPDCAGKNIANPLATILSVAMMLTYSLEQKEAAAAINNAVAEILKKYRTKDIFEEGKELLTCSQMGDAVRSYILNEKAV